MFIQETSKSGLDVNPSYISELGNEAKPGVKGIVSAL